MQFINYYSKGPKLIYKNKNVFFSSPHNLSSISLTLLAHNIREFSQGSINLSYLHFVFRKQFLIYAHNDCIMMI